MKQEVMPPFILSASLQGRAGIWESKQRFLHLPTQGTYQYKVSQACPEALGRWEQGAGDMCPHHQRVLVCCRTVPSRAAVMDSMGRVTAPAQKGSISKAPLNLALNFLLSLLTLCQSCFQGNSSPSLLCCQAGVVGNEKKTHWKQHREFGFFLFGHLRI